MAGGKPHPLIFLIGCSLLSSPRQRTKHNAPVWKNGCHFHPGSFALSLFLSLFLFFRLVAPTIAVRCIVFLLCHTEETSLDLHNDGRARSGSYQRSVFCVCVSPIAAFVPMDPPDNGCFLSASHWIVPRHSFASHSVPHGALTFSRVM